MSSSNVTKKRFQSLKMKEQCVLMFAALILRLCDNTLCDDMVRKTQAEELLTAIESLEKSTIELETSLQICSAVVIAGEFEAVQKHAEGLDSIHMLLWDAKQRLSLHIEFWCDMDGGMSEESVDEEQSCVSALVMLLNGVLSYLNAFSRICGMPRRADDVDRRKIECAMQNLQTCSKGPAEKKAIGCDEFASKDLLCELCSALSELERGMVGRRCFVELLNCRYMSGFDSAGLREKWY